MDPYRDPEQVLRDRLAQIAREIEALAARTRELEAGEAERRRLEQEQKDVEQRLFELDGRGKLEGLRIASPCKANWNDMVGDERVRFCGQCSKNVYNFSAMTRSEATALVKERTGELCVRMYKREDGTVMTADCPVGAKKKVVRRLALVGAGLGAAAAATFFGFGGGTTQTTGALEATPTLPTVASATPVATVEETGQLMGDIAMPMGTVAIPTSSAAPARPDPPRPHMGKVAPISRP